MRGARVLAIIVCVFVYVCVCVCVCVCVSVTRRYCIKTAKVGSRKLRHVIAPEL